MSALAASTPQSTPTLSLTPRLDAVESLALVRRLIDEKLVPHVHEIDLQAWYPEEFMRALGAMGGYAGAVPPEYGGNGLGLPHVIEVMEEVSRTCLSTGFLVWCQTACARYIAMSENTALKERLLPQIARGEVLAGTGLSNTIKSCDTIEDFRLNAKKVEGGYLINGVLPWVSNLGPTHYFTTGCPVEGADTGADSGDDGLVFILVDCSQAGFKLVDCAHFVAMDGTRTLACHFKDSFIPDSMVLSHPGQSAAYIKRIKPGMILAQMGMGLGLIDACLSMMKQSNKTHAHVNQYLDHQVDDIAPVLADARVAALAMATELQYAAERGEPIAKQTLIAILKLRLAGGELSLTAANAALLHLGAKGYLQRSPAQRRLREAYFIAIVTPATKHLRREIARLERSEMTIASANAMAA